MDLILQLMARRDALQAELDALVAAPTAEARDASIAGRFTDEEETRFRALTADEGEDSLNAIDARIKVLYEQEERKRVAAEQREKLGLGSGTGITHVSEALTYRRDNQAQRSYLRDLGMLAFPGATPDYYAASQRLARHGLEMEEYARTHPDSLAARSLRYINERMGTDPEMRALNTSVGSGGTWLPPDYLLELTVKFPRQARVLADLVRKMALPHGPMTIELPKIASGTATAAQASQNTAVQETDLTDEYVTAAVNTFAGKQTVSLQAIEQSAIPYDEIVFEDLNADLDREIEFQVVAGSGSSGNATGVVNVASVNSATYTDNSPTAAKAWPFIGQAKALVYDAIKRSADTILMTPDRWSWFEAATDSNGRPLITPIQNGPFANAGLVDGQMENGPQAAGRIFGLPVYVTAEIPTNLGGGSNQDEILVLSVRDLFLWEGAVVARALPQTLGDELSVILQVYEYAAFMPNRLPGAISLLGGTGLTTPSF